MPSSDDADAQAQVGGQPRSMTSRLVVAAAIVMALGYAAVFHTEGFRSTRWFAGDLAYHRGVSYTMVRGDFQGEGPLDGILTFFGGLFSLAMAAAVRVTGRSFDALLSAGSWIYPLLMLGALWFLARRLWPEQMRRQAVFVLLATVAGPASAERTLLWVESTLLAGQSWWPVFPRDVLLLLMVLMVAVATFERSLRRDLGLAVLGGLAVATQAPMAVVALAITVLVIVSQSEADLRSRLTSATVIVGGSVLLSAWWWIPRILTLVDAGALDLSGQPGRDPLQMTPALFLKAAGVVGILAVSAVAHRRRSTANPVIVKWLLVLVPLLVISRLLGGDALLFDERRLWLIAAIPIVALATEEVVVLLDRIKPAWLSVPALVGLAFVAGAPQALNTDEFIDVVYVDFLWEGQTLDEGWSPLLASLRKDEPHDDRTVATYTRYGDLVWSFTGIQPDIVWFPGRTKVGYPPESLGLPSIGDRIEENRLAFLGGYDSICAHATATNADLLVLDTLDGLTGVYDEWPAARYRVPPSERTEETLIFRVEPGVDYVNRNRSDYLDVAEGASVELMIDASDVDVLVVEIEGGGQVPEVMRAIAANGVELIPTSGRRRFRSVERLEVPPEAAGLITIETDNGLRLSRATGFASEARFVLGGSIGPRAMPVERVCG